MTGSHVLLDHILLVMIALVWPVAEWRWYYPRSVRAIGAGIPGARARLYRNSVAPQWIFSACVICLWAIRARPWALLMLGPSTPLRLGIALVSAALSVAVLPLQRRTLYARPNWPDLVRRTLAYAEPLVPRTTGEYRGMIVVALTAGICEEFLFRGFVTWYFQVLWPGSRVGLVLAVTISAIIFGFAHIYVGLRHVWVSAIVGLFFAVVVLAAGSLVPAMIMHAAMDLNSFDLGYRVLRKTGEPESDRAISGLS